MFDPSRPDGTQQKLLDVGRMKIPGWEAKIGLSEVIAMEYEYFTLQSGS